MEDACIFSWGARQVVVARHTNLSTNHLASMLSQLNSTVPAECLPMT